MSAVHQRPIHNSISSTFALFFVLHPFSPKTKVLKHKQNEDKQESKQLSSAPAPSLIPTHSHDKLSKKQVEGNSFEKSFIST